eukprot:Blabericola_migrator_1__10088@NODE_55_length_16001_cov_154_094327_g51_i0_p1_GENE_NODE_55_length_16001_cov_154_094327_g51_i0NODE_55_length_16001_cov_154_094327_g51_i0_p1_ORF_typecomplete_len693_score94_82GST_C_3/PF14497_6/9_9e06GST_C_3/PF14497_6/0_14GST_C_3/PF14497_6/0_0016GST_C/PF00043_25/0_046GST_C/PF00043_25/0_21GST_C/PF00043_25/85GST_C_2/PF13410_6/0_11GST_C_2/PF13410_6/5_5GST_C_2/PF13410_6/21GST_N/PF02798_20/15GST_N/PF02798_20/0_016GST_N_3/PF13417_6/17GST_N_3/PF13417_6/2_2GST_C_5/PF16865_5/11
MNGDWRLFDNKFLELENTSPMYTDPSCCPDNSADMCRGRRHYRGHPRGGFYHPWRHPMHSDAAPPFAPPPIGRLAFGDHHSVRPTIYYRSGVDTAEPCRLCFILGNVLYYDRKISGCATTPYLVTDNGVTLTQGRAMLTYASTQAGLVPAKFADQMQAITISTMLLESLSQFAEAPESDVKQNPNWIKSDNLIRAAQSQGSPYAVGDRVSYLDACVAGVLRSLVIYAAGPRATPPVKQGINELLTQIPTLKSIMNTVYSLPIIEAAVTKLPQAVTLTYTEGWEADVLKRCMDLNSLDYVVNKVETLPPDIPMLPHIYTTSTLAASGFHACMMFIDQWKNTSSANRAYHVPDATGAMCGSYIEMVKTLCDQMVLEGTSSDVVIQGVQRINSMLATTCHAAGFAVGSEITVVDIMMSVLLRTLAQSKIQFTLSHSDYVRIASSANAYETITRPRTQSKPKLYYFKLPFLGLGPRMMFKAAGVSFEDVSWNEAEWVSTFSSRSRTGNAPWLEMDGVEYYETPVVCHVVAELCGFLAPTREGRLVSDTIASLFISSITPQLVWVTDADKRADFLLGIVTEPAQRVEAYIRSVQSCDSHCVGHTHTWIDFFLAAMCEWFAYIGLDTSLRHLLPQWYKIHASVLTFSSVQDMLSQDVYMSPDYILPPRAKVELNQGATLDQTATEPTTSVEPKSEVAN